MGSISYSQAIRPDTARIKKLVENSLLFDWVIRIEYAADSSESGWHQWDNTFFALRSADAVIDAITRCYTANLGHTIRINAEKLRPQTSMLFTVYNPDYLHQDTENLIEVAATRARKTQYEIHHTV